MRVLLQRVNHAAVTVDGKRVGEIAHGLTLLIGFSKEDDQQKLRPMAEKVLNLRIFPDDNGRFHYSLLDVQGGVLLVPQFTLYGDASKGRRPEFFQALEPKLAKEFFETFATCFRELGAKEVACGVFGAHMQVELVNDGPVTLMLES